MTWPSPSSVPVALAPNSSDGVSMEPSETDSGDEQLDKVLVPSEGNNYWSKFGLHPLHNQAFVLMFNMDAIDEATMESINAGLSNKHGDYNWSAVELCSTDDPPEDAILRNAPFFPKVSPARLPDLSNWHKTRPENHPQIIEALMRDLQLINKKTTLPSVIVLTGSASVVSSDDKHIVRTLRVRGLDGIKQEVDSHLESVCHPPPGVSSLHYATHARNKRSAHEEKKKEMRAELVLDDAANTCERMLTVGHNFQSQAQSVAVCNRMQSQTLPMCTSSHEEADPPCCKHPNGQPDSAFLIDRVVWQMGTIQKASVKSRKQITAKITAKGYALERRVCLLQHSVDVLPNALEKHVSAVSQVVLSESSAMSTKMAELEKSVGMLAISLNNTKLVQKTAEKTLIQTLEEVIRSFLCLLLLILSLVHELISAFRMVVFHRVKPSAETANSGVGAEQDGTAEVSVDGKGFHTPLSTEGETLHLEVQAAFPADEPARLVCSVEASTVSVQSSTQRDSCRCDAVAAPPPSGVFTGDDVPEIGTNDDAGSGADLGAGALVSTLAPYSASMPAYADLSFADLAPLVSSADSEFTVQTSTANEVLQTLCSDNGHTCSRPPRSRSTPSQRIATTEPRSRSTPPRRIATTEASVWLPDTRILGFCAAMSTAEEASSDTGTAPHASFRDEASGHASGHSSGHSSSISLNVDLGVADGFCSAGTLAHSPSAEPGKLLSVEKSVDLLAVQGSCVAACQVQEAADSTDSGSDVQDGARTISAASLPDSPLDERSKEERTEDYMRQNPDVKEQNAMTTAVVQCRSFDEYQPEVMCAAFFFKKKYVSKMQCAVEERLGTEFCQMLTIGEETHKVIGPQYLFDVHWGVGFMKGEIQRFKKSPKFSKQFSKHKMAETMIVFGDATSGAGPFTTFAHFIHANWKVPVTPLDLGKIPIPSPLVSKFSQASTHVRGTPETFSWHLMAGTPPEFPQSFNHRVDVNLTPPANSTVGPSELVSTPPLQVWSDRIDHFRGSSTRRFDASKPVFRRRSAK